MNKIIMKNSTLIIVVLILVFISCEKDKQTRRTTCVQSGEYEYLDNYKIDSMCTSDICTEYLAIWKGLIKEKNNLSQDFLDTHLELCESEIHSWADGISFTVCYKFKIGWAIAYNCDQFIIKINSDNTLYPSLDLPRDIYLTKEKIKIAVDNRAFSSGITKIANVNKIKFSTMENALSDLIEFSGVNQLCLNQVTINEDNGDLILKAFAQYENEENSCIEGTIDLITGDKNINDTPCWIN
jgi:hypothetical protein